MPHFTSQKISPDKKQLAYIMAFARFYDATTHNEQLARAMACSVADTPTKNVAS